MIDFNCYIGKWPFYKLRKHSFEDLKAVHKENGIDCGYVSSIDSIFYNDFYESEKELHEAISGSGYRQVVTVNPTLSACALTLNRCIEEFDVHGIRLTPGYHGYELNSELLDPIIELAEENSLPIFITARMTDERMTHILHPDLLKPSEITDFVSKNTCLTLILSHFKDYEIEPIAEELKKYPKVFMDTSGFAAPPLMRGRCRSLAEKQLYGSAFPLKCVKSSALMFECELEDEEAKRAFFNGTYIEKYLV